MLSIEGKRNRIVAVECLVQFVECAIHAFLLARNIYPRSTFACHIRFGLAVWLCGLKPVKSYVKQVCQSLQNVLLHDRVHAIVIETPYERFTIELPTDFGKTVFYSLPASGGRTDLETRSLCSVPLRDALVNIDRKLGECKGMDLTGAQPDKTWEVTVDIKPSNAQFTETMDMPSGWLLEASNPVDVGIKLRKPIKSVMIGDNVVISTYTDLL